MAAGDDWSHPEVRATVLDYLSMLKLELAGQPYNKSVHRRALLSKLGDRSASAVELKHQNISAVLRDLGHFWIPGYKPRSNYQAMLASEVESCVGANPEIDRHALSAAEAPAATPEYLDFESFEVSSPLLREGRTPGIQEYSQAAYANTARVGMKRDYAAREANNSSLGRAGEELVVRFEQFRLVKAGKARLAKKVEHVSQTQGDGLGFDVLSFDSEGRERYIEVKTTAFAKETPFYASSSELRFARENVQQFSLLRLFEFRKDPKCYTLNGAIHEHCTLDPVTFRCSFS